MHQQKSRIPYEDEQAMTQIYGKALYQKGRTTVRDPYLHFQNEAKSRAARIPSPKRVESMLVNCLMWLLKQMESLLLVCIDHKNSLLIKFVTLLHVCLW